MLSNIDLIVSDMAGTIVEEGGLVYKVLRDSMVEDGLQVSEAEMHPWHGAKKEAVIAHFARAQVYFHSVRGTSVLIYSCLEGTPEDALDARVNKIGDIFLQTIDEAYFSDSSPIEHIDLSLVHFISGLQVGEENHVNIRPNP